MHIGSHPRKKASGHRAIDLNSPSRECQPAGAPPGHAHALSSGRKAASTAGQLRQNTQAAGFARRVERFDVCPRALHLVKDALGVIQQALAGGG